MKIEKTIYLLESLYMFDFLDKYSENKKISEGLFDNIFGKNKVEPQQNVEEPVSPSEPEPSVEPAQKTQNYKKPRNEFERGKVYEFDLTKIPILGRFTNPITNLSFKSPEEFKAFKAILYYLNSGYFDNDINNLKRAIKYKEIDGYGPFVYLSSVFNNNKGTVAQGTQSKNLKEVGNIKFSMPKNSKLQPKAQSTPVQNTNSEGFSTVDSMRRLEKFVKYFVENIVDSKGVANNSLRNSIIIRLKKLIGTNISAPKKVAPVSKPISTEPIEPGAKPEDLEKSGEDTINYALKGLKENVRKIIRDNF